MTHRALANNIRAASASLVFGTRQAFAAWPVLMGRCIFYLVATIIIVALWDKVTSARLPHTLAAYLPEDGLALYVGVTEWITLSIAAVHLKLEDDIRSGALEPHLLRPKPYLLQKIAEQMGATLARLAALGTAGLVALALSGRAAPPLPAFFYVAVLGVLAAFIGVFLYALVGLTAFWLRRVLPPYMIVQKLYFILGGLFAPITLYPRWLFRFAVATPFASLFFAGQQTIEPSFAAFLKALQLGAFWLAVLSVLIALAWSAGMARTLKEGLP
jgi:ABC-2 type transport system permease protein